MPRKNFAIYKLLMLMAFCTITLLVNAQEAVQASINTFDYQGCVPVKVQFADNSTGNPTSWFWDFGNGSTSTQSNPYYTYTIPGTYTVKLVVANAISTDSAFREIVISGAKADFNYTYTNICTTPATVNFAAVNPLNRIIYRWDFGDTHKAIIPNPSNQYDNAGTYKVRLTTISPEGCTDSILKVIQTGGATVNFNAPATTCVKDYVTFTDTSTPHSLSATWLINNKVAQQGGSSFTYQFTSQGTYNIQLAENFGSCNGSKQLPIQVLDKPTASFSISGKTKSCTYPDTVQFTNTSVNAVTYMLYFGDGESSTDVNTTHIYKAGKFSPMLVAYNANGCTDTLLKTDAIFLGGAIISGFNVPDSGCIPHPVTFNANIAAPEAIASYAWTFGDGGTATVAQPSHTYTDSGRYNISLTVTTVSGCTSKYVASDGVSVGTHSIPDFTADKTTVCGSDTVHFKGSASGPVSAWLWKFSGYNVAFKQDAMFSYGDIGSKTVKLIVNNTGCLDSVIKKDFIVVNPPVASFKQLYFCNDRSKVQFVDKSVSPQSWSWNFGDGSTIYQQQSPPVHEYTAEGKYYVSLTTKNGDCLSTYRDSVYIINKPPVFTYIPADGRVCRKTGIELGVVNPSYVLDYLWDMKDGHTLFSDTSIVYTYFKTGVYYPSLIARYHNGCQDTIQSPKSITVTGPTAGFATVLSANCLNDTTVFTDKSFSDGEHDITARVWSYGDEVSENNNIAPYTHLYTASGTFKASLAIADNNNCVDTARYNVLVNALPAVSAGLDTYVCEGSNIQLQPSGALSYVWDRNQGLSCLSCTNPEAAPLQDDAYTVTGYDANSCRASDTVTITVVHPQTLTVNDAPPDICATKTVQLSASGTDLYTWSPAEGLSSATISNPLASPAATSTYTVTGTDSKQCFSQTGTVIVTVHPNPEVTIVSNELVVAKGSRNLITTTGSDNIVKWYWYPPEGLSCTNCPQPIVEAEKTTNYNAVVYSDFGCTDTAVINVHVLCNQSEIYIPSAFTPNGDGKNEKFYVKSSIDNPIRTFVIYNRAGEMIFSKKGNSTNYSADGWDGTYRGVPVPLGTYIYRIEIVCNNTVVPFTGTVTLIR